MMSGGTALERVTNAQLAYDVELPHARTDNGDDVWRAAHIYAFRLSTGAARLTISPVEFADVDDLAGYAASVAGAGTPLGRRALEGGGFTVAYASGVDEVDVWLYRPRERLPLAVHARGPAVALDELTRIAESVRLR